jgi:hypothetical protein
MKSRVHCSESIDWREKRFPGKNYWQLPKIKGFFLFLVELTSTA